MAYQMTVNLTDQEYKTLATEAVGLQVENPHAHS